MMNPRSPYASMVQQQRGSQIGPGTGIRPQPRMAPPPAQRQQAGGGAAGGLGNAAAMGGAMSMMSDENSKKEIQRLEGANEALAAALSSAPKASYPDVNAPSPAMQALGQQPAMPSSASFPDSPAADRVAAQNVGLQAGGAPMPQTRPPDLSALDEAYKRMGQGG